MSKILKRPLFNMGGRAGALNSGIISGFSKGGMTRPTYQQGGIATHTMPNGTVMRGATHQNRNDYKHGGVSQRQGFSRGSYVDMLDEYVTKPTQPQGMTSSDYLRLAAAGAQIMGATPVSSKSGIGGALANSAGALSNLGTDLANSRDTRDASYRQELNAYNRLRAGTAIEQRITQDSNQFQRDLQDDQQAFSLEKVEAETEAAISILQKELDLFPDKYKKEFQLKESRANELIEEMKNPELTQEDYLQKKDILINIVYGDWTRLITSEKSDLMKDDDFLKAMNRNIQDAVALSKIKPGEPGHPNKYTGMTATAISKQLYTRAFEESGLIDLYVPPYSGREASATGGRVGRNMGGPMDMSNALPTPGFEPGSGPDPDPGSPPVMTASADQPMSLTFKELRQRLPAEVSDNVIQLILNSEEAMIDFAQLQTPQDITRFNQKYNTDLELPTVA